MGLGRNGSRNLRSPRFWGQPRLFGRRLLLVTSAAGKSLPNVEDLAGECTYARAHGFRAIFLSGIAREPGLCRRRRELAPRELSPRCDRSSMQEELVLEVLLPARSCLHCLAMANDGRISFVEKFPTDELYRRRRQQGGIPLPHSIRTLAVLKQVPTRSCTRLAVLASKS